MTPRTVTDQRLTQTESGYPCRSDPCCSLSLMRSCVSWPTPSVLTHRLDTGDGHARRPLSLRPVNDDRLECEQYQLVAVHPDDDLCLTEVIQARLLCCTSYDSQGHRLRIDLPFYSMSLGLGGPRRCCQTSVYFCRDIIYYFHIPVAPPRKGIMSSTCEISWIVIRAASLAGRMICANGVRR